MESNLSSENLEISPPKIPPKRKKKLKTKGRWTRQKSTAIMPNGEIRPIEKITKFIKEHGITLRAIYDMKNGLRRRYKGIHIIWGEVTPEKLKEAFSPLPEKKRAKKHIRGKKRGKKKVKTNLEHSFSNIDHEELYFRTRIRRYIFTHPETKQRFQIFARNRKQAEQQVKFQRIIPEDHFFGHRKLRKYFVCDLCDRIVAPNLPIVIWREYDLGMLKKFGFRLGKKPV